MKLQCDVEVVNRTLASFGLRSKGRSSRALLSIGQSRGGANANADANANASLFLLICTSKDRSGSKYKLKENIEKFFTWFVEEGKATVRLKEPPVDICLSKAEVGSLKGFLSAVRLAHRGRCVLDPLPVLVSARALDPPRRKLTVLSRKDYPTLAGFPAALEQLQLSFCCLARVDPRVLALRNLRRLDLSSNRIHSLPAALGELGLTELNLSGNRLEQFGPALCHGLRDSLQQLDLSENRLAFLPERFWLLRRLVSLKLDRNRLEAFPFLVGRLSRLRWLSAAQNRISVLPQSFRTLSLQNLDLFGNPLAQNRSLEPSIQLTFPLSLQELAARAVKDHRLSVGPGLLPLHLLHELDCSSVCVCGRACVSACVRAAVSMSLHAVAHTVVLVDSMGGTEAPVHKHFCSLQCYCQFLDQCALSGTR